MNCNRCGGLMVGQVTFSVESYVCITCGNAHYPAFPKRPAPGNICNACGEEFEKKNLNTIYCPSCKKLIGKNFKKLKQHMDTSYALPWSDRKQEAALASSV